MNKIFIPLFFLCISALHGLDKDSLLVKGANELCYQGDCHWRAESSFVNDRYPVAPEYSEFMSDGLELLSLGSSSVFLQKLSSVLVAAARGVDVLLGSYPKMREPGLKVGVLECVSYSHSRDGTPGRNGYDWLAVNPKDQRFRGGGRPDSGGDSHSSPFNFWHNPFDDAAAADLGPSPWLVTADIAALWSNQLHKLQSLRHQKRRFSQSDVLAKYNKTFRTEEARQAYFSELKTQLFLLFCLLILRIAYVKAFKRAAAGFTQYHALHGLHHTISLYRRHRWNAFQSKYLSQADKSVTAAAA